VTVSAVLGSATALLLPPVLGIDRLWGTAGLTVSASIAGWIEFTLLRSSLAGRIGPTGLPPGYAARLWTASLAGAALGWGVRIFLPPLHPLLRGAAILPAFGAAYLGVATLLGVPIPGLRRR
jgi:putative peptidoglycan lipid II flippase